MTRDVTKEEQEAIKQIAHNEGVAEGRKEQRGIDMMYMDTLETALASALDANRILKIDLVVLGRVQWRKMFSVVVAGSVVGCGMILAVAVGLSHL